MVSNKMQQAQNSRKYEKTGSFSLPTKQTSMCSLIIWNISKALENNPCIDLRHAMQSAHERLGRESRDAGMISQPPEERHLTCALLAWHQLGHKDTDSLYQFIEQNRSKPVCKASENYLNKENIDSVNRASVSSLSKNIMHNMPPKDIDSFDFHTDSLMGPVVKLPMETAIVMRLENVPRHDCLHHSPKKTPTAQKPSKFQHDIMSKIDAACCLDKACVERLTELDRAVSELRSRAAKLARREAERVALLERAESAWRDLELGYQRRLSLALEKEDDLTKQIDQTIEERNNYKNICTSFADTLKERSDLAEKERDRLTSLDKTLCDRACTRLRLSEEAARGDAELADQLCRANQLDRDLRFKEDQARRKAITLEGEVESIQCLTHEAERSMRAELSFLKEQVTNVANQLIEEESKEKNVEIELDELRKEKEGILEDLDGCKAMCDKNMQGKIDKLKKKRDEINQLKHKVIECRCKFPLDAAVEVKRTPSLAALCNCAPEDKFVDSCSCTSLRSQILSNLLADLFGGLQSELDDSGSLMPCQLLKCLEDKHNWDRPSVVKANLKNFFEQLLVSELDIAIATSIEKYHAKWVGASCADAVRSIPGPGDLEGQDRAIERRAQKLATQLAEQLFKERTEEITKRAKEIVTKGPPPCKCETQHAAVFPCLVKTPITSHSARKTTEFTSPYLKRTQQDVTQLKVQIEDLKKEIIKKEDLRLMEEKIARMVKRASNSNRSNNFATSSKKNKNDNGSTLDNNLILNTIKCPESFRCPKTDIVQSSNNGFSAMTKKNVKLYKKIEQSFAVNVCLCSTQDNKTQNFTQNKRRQTNCIVGKIPSYKKPKRSIFEDKTISQNCPSKCICFNKIPSNSSIDKLLEALKVESDLHYPKEVIEKQANEDKNLNQTTTVNNNVNKNGLVIKTSEKKIDNNASYSKIPSRHSDSEFYSTKEENDKSTDYVYVIPGTKDSEYIGEINLDKSNENSCSCLNNNKVKLKFGDDKYNILNTSLPCIKTKDKTSDNSTNEKVYSTVMSKVDLKKVSQVYSMKLPTLQVKRDVNMQMESLNTNESKISRIVSKDTFVGDILKNSDLLSRNRDYQIRLLGVTLANGDNSNHHNENGNKHEMDRITTTSLNKTTKISLKELSKSKIYELNRNSNVSLTSLVGLIPEKGKNSLTFNIKNEQQKCICCNTKNTEESNEIEINAFKLLEEHLKGKLEDFQKSSCKSNCITADEERSLFSMILTKVKEIISENTNEITCKCIGSNEESWKRAYGLLQEYLKIKINRVQCCCVSNNNCSDDVLPTIMKKMTDLIENDFQRLREKCKCHTSNFTKHTLKDWKEQTTETFRDYNDTFVQFDDCEKENLAVKLLEDTSVQMLSSPLSNKSCEAILTGKDTKEKKVSCELKKTFITDCNCRKSNAQYASFENSVMINSYLESILPKTNNMASISSSKKCSSISFQKKSHSSQAITVTKSLPKYPYIGRTLHCSCDPSFGVCYCSKLLTEKNKKKIDNVWKSLTNESIYKNISYIMPKVLTKGRSELISKTNSDGLYSNLLYLKQNSLSRLCNVETTTSNNEEIILKKESMYGTNNCFSNNCCLSVATEYGYNKYADPTKEMHENSCSKSSNTVHKINQKTVDSLHFYRDNIFDCTKKCNIEKTHLLEPILGCDCQKVPICHVKMLVDEIEKKKSNRLLC